MLIPDIIEQHFEEAAFLWNLRVAAADKPSFSLQTLCELDERLEAHLDGLRLAGAEGAKLWLAAAAWDEPGEAFAVGVLAVDRQDSALWQNLIARCAANPALGCGAAAALSWVTTKSAEPLIAELLAADSPRLRRIGLDAAAAHRLRVEAPLVGALRDPDTELAARACRAVVELGRVDLVSDLRKLLDGPAETAFWAAWALALLAPDSNVLRNLETALREPSPVQQHALQVIVRRLDLPAALRLQRELAGSPECARLAISASAAIGDAEVIPWLLSQVANPDIARLAADAFQSITGVDFVTARLRRNSPPRPPVAEDLDAETPPDPDFDLLWPEPDALRGWWEKHRQEFPAGVRRLLGKTMTPTSLRETLRDGMNHQRAAAVLELTIRNPGQPSFNLHAPGPRQRVALAGSG